MANLYNKAGLVNIPVGYQEGFLYNIKPEDNTLAFRFNRDSAATRVNKEGLIEQVVYFGPELVTNGDFSDNTNNWETGGSSSISVGDYEGRTDVANINISNTSPASRIRQNFNYVNGKKYKVSVDVFVVSGSFRIDCSDSFVSGDFVSTSTTGSWLTLTAEIEAIQTGSNKIWLRGLLEVSQFYVSNVSITEVLGDKPRIDYTDSLTSPSFLLEPQSTNLIPYSEDFSQWSAINGVVVTNNFITSPDGTQNAAKLVYNGTTGSRIELNVSSSGTNNQSVYLKTKSGTQNVSIGPSTGSLSQFTITDKWVRYSHVGSGNYPRILCSDAATIYAWGAQLEQLSYPTSYIPTAGSTVTRAQETCNGAGNVSTFNSTEGVLYCEIAALADDGTFRMISVSDGTNDNRARINYTSTNQQIQSRVVVGGAQQAEINKFGFTNVTDFIKIALSYKQNQVKLYINGELIGTDTSVTMPSANTFNVLNFDGSNGANRFYGKTKGVYVFNEALTDDELQQLTGPEYNSFAALAAAYNYTVI